MDRELRLNTPSELRDWLKDKPATWSHVIAIRVALRMLPMIASGMKLTEEPSWDDQRVTLVTSVFRACYLSLTEYKFSSGDTITVADNEDDPLTAAYAADVNISKHIARDAAWLEMQSKADNPSQATRLVEQPLWHESAPQSLQADWKTFKSSPLAADNGYQPWIRWYEAVAPFDPQTAPRDLFSDDLTQRIAAQPNEWWNRPTLDINNDIKRWLAEEEAASESPIEALDQLPGQQPAPYQFEWRDGRIEVLPPDGLPEDGGLAQDYLDETREKADSLLNHLTRSNVDPDIARKVGKLRAALTQHVTELRPAVVYSRTITMKHLLKAFNNPYDREEISSSIIADLEDLTETAQALCQTLPELRSINTAMLTHDLERRAQNVKQHGALNFDLSSRFARQIDSDLTRYALAISYSERLLTNLDALRDWQTTFKIPNSYLNKFKFYNSEENTNSLAKSDISKSSENIYISGKINNRKFGEIMINNQNNEFYIHELNDLIFSKDKISIHGIINDDFNIPISYISRNDETRSNFLFSRNIESRLHSYISPIFDFLLGIFYMLVNKFTRKHYKYNQNFDQDFKCTFYASGETIKSIENLFEARNNLCSWIGFERNNDADISMKDKI